MVECECQFNENIYIKSVDRYFKLPEGANIEDFWEANKSVAAGHENEKWKLFEEVKKDVERRKRLPELFAENLMACQRYRPQHQGFFPEPDAAPADAIHVTPGLAAADIFLDEFLELWREVKEGKRPSAVKPVHDTCYQCPFLKESFVNVLKEEIKNFKSQNLPHQQPNSMNKNGCILNEIGFGPFMDRIVGVYLVPVCQFLFPDVLGQGVDAHHSFIVQYGVGMDTSLGVHDDNSEVTVNVALSDDYSGAELALYHRARLDHPQLVDKSGGYHHRVSPGTMLLHPGALLHEVLPLTAGERSGFIIWLRSNAWRRQNGCPLCHRTDRLIYASEDGAKRRRTVTMKSESDNLNSGTS